MRLTDFDYSLPKELIAQYPAGSRDESRMMVLDRRKKTIWHKRFKDIVSYLNKEDSIVLNNTKVIPARLLCRRPTGGKAEIFLLRKIKNNLYEALVRPASRLFKGRKVICEDGKVIAEIMENGEVGKLIKFANVKNLEGYLKSIGKTPLPPYIRRSAGSDDEKRYQTVYAEKDGSTAAPTAGLHFTEGVLKAIKEKGAELAYLTLHVSYGTFAPVKTEYAENHKMHKEYFELPVKTQDIIFKTKRSNGRIMAVGTSTTRVLEANVDTVFNETAKRRILKNWTDLFIYPPYSFRVVDMLLTNFHLPKSTLLMLISAFAGREFILTAYREAIRERYRFYSYGDCMLII